MRMANKNDSSPRQESAVIFPIVHMTFYVHCAIIIC